MTDAFIYDAVRTPRGKGKKDGALHKEEILAYIREYHGKMMELYRESSSR